VPAGAALPPAVDGGKREASISLSKDGPAAERAVDGWAAASTAEAWARPLRRVGRVFQEARLRLAGARSATRTRTAEPGGAEGARPWERLARWALGLPGAAGPVDAAASPKHGAAASGARRDPIQGGGTELSEAVAAARRAALGALALFSLGMNLLVLASPLYMLQVYDRVMVTGRLETLALLTGLTAAALLVYGLLDALRGALLVRVGNWLVDRLGPVYLDSTVRMRLRGEAAGAQPLRDLAQIQAFVASPGLAVFLDLPWVPLSLALVWLLHPALGALALASLLALLALGALNEALTRRPALEANEAQVSAARLADAMARNAEAVRAMGMSAAMIRRWRRVTAAGLEAARRGQETGGLILGATKSARLFVQSAMLGLGAYLFLAGELSGGAMIASSILLGRALQPVEVAVSSWRGLGAARAAWSRLQSLARAVPPERARTRVGEPAGRVAFDRVTYVPPGGSAPVLRDVSFEALPGEALAVVGPSAGGKSTLCRLLVGTAEPSAGEVRLDNHEIRSWDAEELGRHVGYLPQDVELFAGTVRENIARMSEGEGDEAVVAAARLARAHESILRLPRGYDTPVGDGGARLSGGQRQRIGLARAVYRCPRLVVLDEPNANLDERGEEALAEAIAKLKRRGCTVLIVGHRPSTLAQADKVLLLVEGRVAFFGPRGAGPGGPRAATATAAGE